MKWNPNIGARWDLIRKKLIELGGNDNRIDFAMYLQISGLGDLEAEFIYHERTNTMAMTLISFNTTTVGNRNIRFRERMFDSVCEFKFIRG